jgi:hypothetical protein
MSLRRSLVVALATPLLAATLSVPVAPMAVGGDLRATTTTIKATTSAYRTVVLVITVVQTVPVDGATPWGEVRVKGDGTGLGEFHLYSGAQKVTVFNVEPGKHVYTASFVPDPDHGYAASSASDDITVIGTSAVAVDFPDTVADGKQAKGTVTVTGDGLTATGTVTITKNGKQIATAKLNKGKARIKLPKLRAGANKLKAVYVGATYLKGSSKSFTIKQE